MKKYSVLYILLLLVVIVPVSLNAVTKEENIRKNVSAATGAETTTAPTFPQPTDVTPTLFCLGGVPCTTPDPTTTAATPGAGTSTPTNPITTGTTEPSPTVNPCETQSSLQHYKHKKHKKHRGGDGGFLSKFFEFIMKLLEQLLRLFGMPIPENPNPVDPTPTEDPNNPNPIDPTPCPDVTEEPEPSTEPTTDPSVAPTADPSMSVAPSTVTPSAGGQTLGCGGIPAPANAEKPTSTGALTISSGGTAGSPKVYDGACQQVGTITIKADYVTVQNFKVQATGQYGIQSEGTGITIQNNDIKGVHASGDGDLNAITFFGNDTKILYNTAIDFVTGDPGGSHTDGIQTWVSSSHPTASTNVVIKGNKFTGPANPSRSNSIPSIHQCIMAEGLGRGGNSGGNGNPKNWVISDNYFSDSWNQCIKLDGIENVTVTRNEFAGSSDKVMEVTSASPGFKYYSDNKMTGNYKNGVGVTVTQGSGPASQ